MKTELLKGIQPFWFWNGKMEKNEIRRQIQEMADKGIRGFLVHPRQGMELPYLTEDYFDRIGTAVDEAKKHGLEVWLYDEYPYPSGVSAGKVMLDHPEFCCKALTKTVGTVTGPETIELKAPWGRLLSARAYPMVNGQCDFSEYIDLTDHVGTGYQDEIFQLSGLTAYNRKRFFTGVASQYLYWTAPEGEWKVYIFVEEVMKHFKYFENFVDPLNKDAVRYFIQCTHEQYKAHFGDEFGKTIKGIFTDETTAFPPQQPWSPLLPDMIREKYGRDIIDVLPALTEDMGPDTQRIRFEYWDTATDAFIESYDKQIYGWCEENHLMYIGEKPILRSKELEFVHVPGTDAGHAKVGAKVDPLPGKYRANGKVISSAAHFYHKPAALCEAFHSIGWGMTQQDMKWIFDWLAMSGVDWYVQHAFYYTTDGLKKHDAPPSSFCQMPWWKEQKLLSRYADGLGKMLGGLKRHVSTLLVDPATSSWVLVGEEKKEQENALSTVMNALLRAGCDFYMVDPQLLAKASIETREGQTVVVLNGEAYDSIVMPNMNHVEDCAYRLLREYAEQGGLLVAAGDIPVYDVQQEKSAEWFAAAFCSGRENLLKTDLEHVGTELMQRLTHRTWVFQEMPEGVYAICGTDTENNEEVFIVNTTAEDVTVRLHSEWQGALYQWDLAADTKEPKGPFHGTLEVKLDPWASAVYVMKKEQAEEAKAYLPVDLPFAAEDWKIERGAMNALYLGAWQLTLADGQTGRTGSYPILDQMEELGMKMTVKTVPYFGCPKELAFQPVDAVLANTFTWRMPEGTKAWLVMEPGTMLGDWYMEINGHKICEKDFQVKPFYLHTNLAVEVTEHLRKEENEIKVYVHCEKYYDGLRNPLYLFGDFGVEVANGHSIAVPFRGEGRFGRLLQNGLPFYAGDVIYRHDIVLEEAPKQDVLLNLDAPYVQDAVRVHVNGTDCGVVSWTPRQLVVPAACWHQGNNQVELVLSNTMAGLFEGQYFDIDKHKYVQIEDEMQDVTSERSFTAW